jgi:hypothetical protein
MLETKYKLMLFIMAFSLVPRLSFSACEHEAREYTEWSQKCNDYTTAANAACIAGTACALFTFGASLAAPASLVPVAMNMCRIRDEKNLNLTRCQNNEKEKVRRAQRKIDALSFRNARVTQLIDQYRQTQINNAVRWNIEFDQKIKQAISDYQSEGYDLESEESVQHITQLIENLNEQRQQRFVNYKIFAKPYIRQGLEKINEEARLDPSYGLQELIDAGVL